MSLKVEHLRRDMQWVAASSTTILRSPVHEVQRVEEELTPILKVTTTAGMIESFSHHISLTATCGQPLSRPESIHLHSEDYHRSENNGPRYKSKYVTTSGSVNTSAKSSPFPQAFDGGSWFVCSICINLARKNVHDPEGLPSRSKA